MKYEDERLLQVEEEKQNQLDKNNEQFNNLLNERQDLTNQQTDLVNKWEQTQNENLDKQLQFQKDLIEQQKQEANKNYEAEAKSAYTDYRKENNDYGVSREQQAQQGMMGTGYSESSRVSMYNTYQNRLGSARKSMDKAYLEFNNAIKEAQLTNDVTKAENALKALQNKLTISLEGFNYKDATTKDMMNAQNQISNDYYNRYQNTLNQINYENEQEEARRRWEEEMAYRKQQDAMAQQRWQQEMAQRNREISQRYSSNTTNYSGGKDEVVLDNQPELSKFAQDMVKYYESISGNKNNTHNSKKSKEMTLEDAYRKGQINETDLRYLSKYLGLE